jgi:hypothetical protein
MAALQSHASKIIPWLEIVGDWILEQPHSISDGFMPSLYQETSHQSPSGSRSEQLSIGPKSLITPSVAPPARSRRRSASKLASPSQGPRRPCSYDAASMSELVDELETLPSPLEASVTMGITTPWALLLVGRVGVRRPSP